MVIRDVSLNDDPSGCCSSFHKQHGVVMISNPALCVFITFVVASSIFNTALLQEELRSLGATPETIDYNNDDYRISFKNMDAKETKRLRDSLVTPMSSYSINMRSMAKTPVDSCAESVALFKNLANNDHIDLVSSDLKDFMDSCDLDDLISRPSSRPTASASPLQPYRHSKDSLTSTRLSNHNRAEQKRHQETTAAAAASTLLQKLSEPHQQQRHYYPQNQDVEPSAPLRHTNQDGYSNPVIHTHKPTRNGINDSANTNKHDPPISVLEKPKSRAMQYILTKRRSIDSDGLRRLQQSNVEPTATANKLLSKRHSMMSISEYEPTPTKSKLPTTVQRRNSNLQQPAISTVTLKRRNSNMQQPITTMTPLQRRNSNLQQATPSKANMQRRNSSNLHSPVEPDMTLERRSSKAQQQAQPDRRRWSSYIPDHSVVIENQVPQKDLTAPEHASRQEPRKLTNRHSMLLPSSARQYSSEENMYEAPAINQRQSALEQDVYNSETSPRIHAQSTAEKVRRRHTLSASDKRASIGQLPRHTVDKRASLHLAASRVHATSGDGEDDQVDTIPQMQQRRLANNDKRSHQIKTSSYERSIEEPNRYRSKIRNPISNRDYESQLSSSLRTTVLANSKHISPRDYQHHTTRLSKRSELQLQSSHNEATRYRHEPSDSAQIQAYEYEQIDEDSIAPQSRFKSRGLGEQRQNQPPSTVASTITQQRRNRALSAPSNHQQTTDKPSLMPVPVRYRKHSNNSISKYTSVPENAGLTSFSPPREARLYPEEIIQVEASRSSGGLSNSTTSSSHSSDRYYDPPTPPTSAVITTHGSHGKRRSVPVMNASVIDEQVRKTENRYSSYLARIKKDAIVAEQEESNPIRRLVPRRQRAVSEDTENYRQHIEQRKRSQQHQVYRDEDTEDVISSAKHLLSMTRSSTRNLEKPGESLGIDIDGGKPHQRGFQVRPIAPNKWVVANGGFAALEVEQQDLQQRLQEIAANLAFIKTNDIVGLPDGPDLAIPLSAITAAAVFPPA
ncbi:hypothetical protein MAM1_0224d08312 [Mucor ambiguus]|uniref:Uncharacterized protein n=1 Tax=Mucor ambiguus TaxID=91626 RepID=A0A0C9MDS1_9FUNG|nr:hypothetical protein MAM1_0224d08312 [Mucor ambiguus]